MENEIRRVDDLQRITFLTLKNSEKFTGTPHFFCGTMVFDFEKCKSVHWDADFFLQNQVFDQVKNLILTHFP